MPRKKVTLYEMLDLVLNNLQYYFDYNFDTDYHCNEYGNDCESEGICRCSTIENFKINSMNFNDIINQLFNHISSYESIDDIDKYCICRLLVKHGGCNIDNYDYSISGGYYGEEVDYISFNNKSKFIQELEFFIRMKFSNIEKIHYVLTEEYKYVLDSLKQYTDVERLSVSPSDIIIGKEDHYIKIANDEKLISLYEKHELPICLTTKVVDKYKIVDGYHRFYANNKKDKIDILVFK
jgi:hypothetical protein